MKWQNEFLCQLKSLELDSATFNIIAHATTERPDCFQDAAGSLIVFAAWLELERHRIVPAL